MKRSKRKRARARASILLELHDCARLYQNASTRASAANQEKTRARARLHALLRELDAKSVDQGDLRVQRVHRTGTERLDEQALLLAGVSAQTIASARVRGRDSFSVRVDAIEPVQEVAISVAGSEFANDVE